MKSLSAGTYCIVETVVPSRELTQTRGDQLCVLLGFRTTDDNCVDTKEADSERSQVWIFIHYTSNVHVNKGLLRYKRWSGRILD